MIISQNFSAVNVASDYLYVPARKGVKVVIAGVTSSTLNLQISTDHATWSDLSLYTNNGTTYIIPSTTTAYYVRFLCTIFYASDTPFATIANVLDVTGLQAFAIDTVDYVWDYSIQGGALSDIILQPSKLLPAGAVAYWLIRRTLNSLTGSAAVGLGVTGSQGALETDSKTTPTVSLATATLLQGIAAADSIDVKFNITGATLTAGKLQWTLFYQYPTF